MIHFMIRLIRSLNLLGAALAALTIASVFVLIIYEIVLRAFFHSSTYVLDEMVGYGVAASTFLGLGYALSQGSLIRVNILIGVVKNRIARSAIELLSIAVVLYVNTIILTSFWKSIARNFNRNALSETVAQVPLWIPEGVLFVGLCLFSLQLIAYALIVLTGRPLIGEQQSLPIHEQEG